MALQAEGLEKRRVVAGTRGTAAKGSTGSKSEGSASDKAWDKALMRANLTASVSQPYPRLIPLNVTASAETNTGSSSTLHVS